MRKQLSGVDNMASPDRCERRRGNQVLAATLVQDHGDEAGHPLHFGRPEAAAHPCDRLILTQAARALLWSKTADRAAGVTPRTRAAAANDCGRAADKRAIISVESPGTSAKRSEAGIVTCSSARSRRTSSACRAT
jgi:hypothetical protein